MSHTTVYIESLLFCILFLCALFVLNLKHGRSPHFRHLAVIYCMTTLSALLDILWILIDGHEEYALLQYLTHPIYLSCFLVTSAAWFLYCSKFLPFFSVEKLRQKLLIFSPITVLLVLNITSPFTGLMFYLDEGYHYCRGPLYYSLMIGYIYLVVAAVLALKARKEAQFYTVRKQLASIASFCVSPLLLGLISAISPPGSIPSMQFSILFSLFLIFVDDQSIKITHDSLTGLYNRHSLDHFINEHINRYRKNGETFYILMADMNHFKSINDTYGHMEGDRILKIVADILDSIAKDYGGRATRLGGDEFAVVVTCRSFRAAYEIKSRIQRNMSEAGRREDRDLSISIGIAEYQDQMTIVQFLDLADQNLYLEKNHN
jgi:diguanylate cyclase (GGDEF)-like protein